MARVSERFVWPWFTDAAKLTSASSRVFATTPAPPFTRCLTAAIKRAVNAPGYLAAKALSIAG
eukprot:4218161-Lingulodinium_polyedra.AAC.1